MKILLVLVVVASPAAARPVVPILLSFEVMPRSEPPELVPDCVDTAGVATASWVVGVSRVTVIHDCRATQNTTLAIRTADAWFLSALGSIQFDSFTGGQHHVARLVREDVRAGLLFDGSRAVVHSAEVALGEPRPIRFGYVHVCSVAPPIACTPAMSFECEDAGCTAPSLSRGRLIVVDARQGAMHYLINRASEPAPPP